jgi:excinuclease UvrABC nuclease subunit
MADFVALQAAIEELNEKHPRPGIPPLTLSPIYDLKAHWPNQYPCSDQAGVYIALDESKNVVYVGKASLSNVIGKRIGTRIWRGMDPATYAVVADWQDVSVRFIAAIGLDSEHAFEAAAIEEFLIGRLQPPLNALGRHGSRAEVANNNANPMKLPAR